MIEVYFCSLPKDMSATKWNFYYGQLPFSLQNINVKYRNVQDRQRHLFGKLLLQKALFDQGYSTTILENINLTKYQKPFLNDRISFNISHSGEYVVCAISNTTEIGIDIELKKSIPNIIDYKYIFSEKEFASINTSQNAADKFYQLWTRKESILKADGCGLVDNLSELCVDKSPVCFKGRTWFLYDLLIESSYGFSLAATIENAKIKYAKIDFTDFCQAMSD